MCFLHKWGLAKCTASLKAVALVVVVVVVVAVVVVVVVVFCKQRCKSQSSR
jgi:flagellar basal body-associated protein FliL